MRSRRTLAGAVLVALFVGGFVYSQRSRTSCADAFGAPGDRPDDGVDVATLGQRYGDDRPDLVDVAATATGAGRRVRWVAPNAGLGELAVAGDSVVTAVTAVRLWPAIDAYDLATGRLRWAVDVRSATNAQVLALDDVAAVLTNAADAERAVPARLATIGADGSVRACRLLGLDRARADGPSVAVAGDGRAAVTVAPQGKGARVRLFEGADLTPRWTVDVAEPFVRVRLGDDQVYLIANADPEPDRAAIRALDRATGAERWQLDGRELALDAERSLEGTGTVVDLEVVGERLVGVFGLLNGALRDVKFSVPFGRTRSGDRLWGRRDLMLDDRRPRVSSVGGRAVVGVVDVGDEVVALDPATGADVWRTVLPRGSDGEAVAGADAWYLAGRAIAFDPSTGAATPLPDGASVASAAVGTGTVALGMSRGGIVVLDDPA